MKAEVTAEPRHSDETTRARKAVVAVGALLDEVISTLEASRSAFCAIVGPAAESRRDVQETPGPLLWPNERWLHVPGFVDVDLLPRSRSGVCRAR